MVEFVYRNGRVKKVSKIQGRILERARLGHVRVAEEAKPTPQPQPMTYHTASLQADEEISPRTGKPKRQYKRRDMQPEE